MAILALRREAIGEWRTFSVETPIGDATAVYLDPDKNGRQVKAEVEFSRLLKAFKVVLPHG